MWQELFEEIYISSYTKRLL